jgi:hypothetical protein
MPFVYNNECHSINMLGNYSMKILKEKEEKIARDLPF